MRKNAIGYVFLVGLLCSAKVFAYIEPPCLICPTFDGANDAIVAAKGALKTVRTYADNLQLNQDGSLNLLKSLGNYIGLDYKEVPLQKDEGDSALALSREIKEAEVVDVKSEASLAEGFKKLFLENPTELAGKYAPENREYVLKLAEGKRAEFVNDNLMENYLAVRDLDEGRLKALEAEFSTLTNCFVEGNESNSSVCQSASASDEELGNWANAYKLQEMYDSMLRLKEELTAIEAQSFSGEALQRGVRPLNEDINMQEVSAASQSADSSGKLFGEGINLKAFKPNTGLELAPMEKFEGHVPFEGDAIEKAKGLAILDGVYNLLREAQVMHNTKQQMPDLRKPFIEYEKFVQLHREAVKRLADSERKSKAYFADYYGSNADDVWFGDGCHLKDRAMKYCPNLKGCKSENEYDYVSFADVVCPNKVFEMTTYDVRGGVSGTEDEPVDGRTFDERINFAVNQYAQRRGLSGAAISAYVRSRTDVLMNNEDVEVGTATIDEKTPRELKKYNKKTKVKSVMKDADELSLPSNEAYAEDAVREGKLNRFQIGSALSKKVGLDMSQGGGVFGPSAKRYPVWGDEKRFYDQYLNLKYGNILLYLNSDYVKQIIYDLVASVNESFDVDPMFMVRCTSDAEEARQKDVKTCNKNYDTCSSNCAGATGPEGETAAEASARKSECGKACRGSLVYCEDAAQKAYEERLEACDKRQHELEEEVAEMKASNAALLAADRANFESAFAKQLRGKPVVEFKKQGDAKMDAFVKAHEQKIASLIARKEAIYERMDEIAPKMNAQKMVHADNAQQRNEADENVLAQEELIKLEEQKRQQDSTYTSALNVDADERKTQQQKKSEEVSPKADEALRQVGIYETQIDVLKEQIEQIDAQIESENETYIAQAVAMEAAFIAQMAEKIKELEARTSVIGFSAGYFGAGGMTVLSLAEATFNAWHNNVISFIQSRVKQMFALGDKLYDPRNYGTVNKLHQQILDYIENHAFASRVVRSAGYPDFIMSTANFAASSANYVRKAVFDNGKEECSAGNSGNYRQEDSQYFVCIDAGKRDLWTPKRITVSYWPPLRESIHFDSVDYDEVVKTKTPRNINPKTTRYEFWKMKQEVPSVWTRILLKNGLGERDVDIEDILKVGSDSKSDNFLKVKGEKPAGPESELSVFVKYEKGLTLTTPMYDLGKFFDDTASRDDDGDEDEIREKSNRMLSRNQIADYLQFVDQEREYQKALAKLRVKVDDARATIDEALSKASCTFTQKVSGEYLKTQKTKTVISSEFIADEETYQSVLKCLDEGKNMFLSEALEMMNTLPEMNDYLLERKTKLDKMLKSMQMDKEELVSLSDLTEPDATLEENIKQKKTDAVVLEKYDKEAEEEFEKNMERFETPYRAKYF
ncbi:MAG: hypothetical protein IJS26_02965 [Alphaproteobacteria bacterium]|nr:hypothetical protein [Alphaproteobacteria bacterium]